MPNGSLWNATDCIPDLGAPLRERGGWANASADISATVATSAYVTGGIYAAYEAATKHIIVDEDGRFIEVTSESTTTDIAAGVTVAQNPVMHRNIVVVPASGGATNPKSIKYGGSYTVADLAGSPPQAKYATVFKDYTVLANTNAEPQRVYFSDPGDPEGWDTTNVYIDFNNPISAVAAVRNSILVWGDSTMSRLYGSSPPPGTDFVKHDPLFAVGCTDARSVAIRGDRVVFCNPEGIYLTDGSADPVNVTKLCGMLTYWSDQLAGYAKSTWTIVGGFLRDEYHVYVMDGSTFKFGARIDINARAWWPITNIDARSLWSAEATVDELYFGRRGAARVGKLSTIFSPSATVKNDGDGDAVTAVIESPYYEGEMGQKSWKKIYATYELTDHASDGPTAAVSYIRTPEETSYTALSGSLTEGTTRATTKLTAGFPADGLALKIQRSNAGDFLFYGFEAEAHPREQSRRTT